MNTVTKYLAFACMLLNGGSLLLELSENGTFNHGRFSATLGWFVAWINISNEN